MLQLEPETLSENGVAILIQFGRYPSKGQCAASWILRPNRLALLITPAEMKV